MTMRLSMSSLAGTARDAGRGRHAEAGRHVRRRPGGRAAQPEYVRLRHRRGGRCGGGWCGGRCVAAAGGGAVQARRRGRGAGPAVAAAPAGEAGPPRGLGRPGAGLADPAGPGRGGWAGRRAGLAEEPGRLRAPAAGGSPRAGPVPWGSGRRRRQPAAAPDGWPVRPARRRWPVRPPPRAGSSRRRSSTTPCPPSPGRPGSAGTARPRAIRWARSRWPAGRRWRLPVGVVAGWLGGCPRTLAAAPEARRTSPSSDGCLADHSPPLRLPGATTPVSGASFMLCQENGPCRAVPASSRRDPSGTIRDGLIQSCVW